MITLLHGDYIEASRNELSRIKEKAVGKEIRLIDGKSVDLPSLIQSLESTSLFGDTLLVVIERLFAKLGKSPKKVEELASVIQRNGQYVDIVIWEEKEVGTTVIKHLGKTINARSFKLPIYIFQLLDGVRPGNAKQLLRLFHSMKTTDSPELVLAMLVKRLRQLIQLSDGVNPEGLAPWQLTRLTTQAKSFTMGELLGLLEALHAIEVSIKTGTSPFSMEQSIEQFFILL